MECNKDEASRAKEIAERKFMARDMDGAKKFALKAHALNPVLEGLSQLLIILDVHISAEEKVNGEVDWYAILGVNPSDDDETVKKQYRKLALMLHPDKNKYVGADGAFKLVSEAWCLLSDKAKRLAYNQKRNLKGYQQKINRECGIPSSTPSAKGFHQFDHSATSGASTQNNATRVCPTTYPPPSYKKTVTFWTACNKCNTQYEYLRTYLNLTLLCPSCHEAFWAVEKAPPSKIFEPSNWSNFQQQLNSTCNVPNDNPYDPQRNASVAQNLGQGARSGFASFNRANFHWNPSFKTVGGNFFDLASTAAQAASVMIHQENEKAKRKHEGQQAAVGWERSFVYERMHTGLSSGFSSFCSTSALSRDRPLKKERTDDGCTYKYGGDMTNHMVKGNGRYGMGSVPGLGKDSCKAERVCSVSNTKLNSSRELSLLETRNMLMDKAQKEIRNKLREWRLAAEATGFKEGVKEKHKTMPNNDVCDLNNHSESANTKREFEAKKLFPKSDNVDEEASGAMSINVPDPDFHDFDNDRTESSFKDNQVWAAYDHDDGMPRYYAFIRKMISVNPFKIRISWLNSRSNNELGPIDWVGSGFSKTCGDFWIGRHEINDTLNSFSHEVKWTKGKRGVFCIFPRKGDVWALYRNWSPDWNEDTPEKVIHKYDMVEVLDDYNEEQGVSVTPLVKVVGFRTVFHRNVDPKEVKMIQKEEMFRFSHQVPTCLLTGREGQNAPVGCWELDPAATPVELLQVVTDDREAPIVKNLEKSKEERFLTEQNVDS